MSVDKDVVWGNVHRLLAYLNLYQSPKIGHHDLDVYAKFDQALVEAEKIYVSTAHHLVSDSPNWLTDSELHQLLAVLAFSMHNEAFIREPIGSRNLTFVHEWCTGVYKAKGFPGAPYSYAGQLGNSKDSRRSWDTDCIRFRGGGSHHYTGRGMYQLLGIAFSTDDAINDYFSNLDKNVETNLKYIDAVLRPTIVAYKKHDLMVHAANRIGYTNSFFLSRMAKIKDAPKDPLKYFSLFKHL
jgi:hypothetical protein